MFVCRDVPESGSALVYAPTLKMLIACAGDIAEEVVGFTKGLNLGLEPTAAQVIQTLTSALAGAVTPKPASRRTPTVFALSVAISRDCPLRCIYCHAEAGEQQDSPPELLLDALEHAGNEIRSRGLKALHVSFAVGGEPTCRWSVFHDFVLAVNKKALDLGVPCFKSITTNGFYQQKVAEFVSAQFDSVLLSFDGPQAVHDFHRPTKSGTSSYAQVLENAE